MLPERQRPDSPIPMINIIQHVRHAEEPGAGVPSSIAAIAGVRESRSHRRRRGHRICNGPLVTIPNAIDLPSLPDARPRRGAPRTTY